MFAGRGLGGIKAIFTSGAGAGYTTATTGSIATLAGSGLSSMTSGITSFGNGWYRCWFKVTSSGSSNFAMYVGSASGDNGRAYSGTNGAAALYLWGAQFEKVSAVTDYNNANPT